MTFNENKLQWEDYVKIVKKTGVGCAYDEVKDMSIDEATEYLFTCRMMSPIEDIEKNEEDRKIKYEEHKKNRKTIQNSKFGKIGKE